MVELGGEMPWYGFASHKGYSAPEHLAALARFGPSREHRLTFRSVFPRRDDEAVHAARSERAARAADRARRNVA